jgi:hypothetical protein
MRINSFILETQSCFFLEEEKYKFRDDISELEKILSAINPNIKINYIKLNKLNELNSNNQENILYTLLPYEEINKEKINHKILLLDKENIWSRFNFLRRYLKINDFRFDSKKFRKVLYSMNRYTKMTNKRDRFLRFLPFRIVRYDETKVFKHMTLFEKFSFQNFPVILFKDMSFDGKMVSVGTYGSYYNKPASFKRKFNKVITKLGDEKSKNNYKISLFGKAEDNWKKYFDCVVNNIQYSDFITLDENSIIINCGVAYGTELCLFNDVKKIYNIDPSGPHNLSGFIKEFIKKSKTEQIYIQKFLYSDGGLPETQKGRYSSTSLIDVIDEYKINKIDLIKTDVEGAERYMVKDLIRICEKFRPQLAISIYHTNHGKNKFLLTDIVDIPLRLTENLKNYSFFIGHYCFERWEMIFYCIPKEQKLVK